MKFNNARCLFIVQGEGRGHMTQALAFKKTLEYNGYIVSAVMVGSSVKRQIPDFFTKGIGVPVYMFQSPNFITDKDVKSIKILKCISYNIKLLPVFLKNLKLINNKVKEFKPDLIINFYEPLTGLYKLIYNSRIPVVSVAHQYVYLHPEFKFPKEGFWQKMAIKFFTRLTALGSKKKFAISFYPLRNQSSKLIVIPPLLRKSIYRLKPLSEDFFLTYILNKGLSNDIIEWHKTRPDVMMHCFWDRTDVEEEYKYDETLTFHKLNDEKFLQLMASCKGFITTAGFESVCEAMYLKKPIFMMPVKGHYEQYCNARDANKVGAGMFNDDFIINPFVDALPFNYQKNSQYREWVKMNQEIIIDQINELVSSRMNIGFFKTQARQIGFLRRAFGV